MQQQKATEVGAAPLQQETQAFKCLTMGGVDPISHLPPVLWQRALPEQLFS